MRKTIYQLDYKDSDQIASYLKSLWEGRLYSKWSLERQWFQNIAWYMGYQNTVWNQINNTLDEPRTPPWRVRLIINLLQPSLRTSVAKMFKSRPKWDVLPATDDSEDIQIAELSRALLDYDWDRLRMTSKWLEALFWLGCTGNAFIRPLWDPDKGPELNIPPSLISGNETISVGETDVRIITPFEITPDPLAKTMEECGWVMHSYIQHVDDLRDTFGDKKTEHIKPDESEVSSTHQFHFLRRIQNLTNRIHSVNVVMGGGAAAEDRDHVITHELWIKPRRGHSKLHSGRHLIIAQGHVLKNEDFPYDHGELPYIHLREITVPGRFWATSTCEQLLPIQADYNKARSQIIESRNMMSKPKWMVPKGADISANALTSEPGEIVEHTPGLSPEPARMPELPQYVMDTVHQGRQDIEDVSGIHEPSKAQAPGQIRSGRGVLALIEQDEARLAPVVVELDQCLENVGRQLLRLNAQFVREERIIKITGERNEIIVKRFKGSDLLGGNQDVIGANYFDVRITTSSVLPYSRAAQQEYVGNLINQGVLNPQEDKKLILELLNIGTVETIVDKSRIHRGKQIQENQAMLEGSYVEPQAWNDHDKHIDVITDFMNSSRFDQLEPELQELFVQHLQRHKELLAYEAVEAEMLIRNAAQGMIQGTQLQASPDPAADPQVGEDVPQPIPFQGAMPQEI